MASICFGAPKSIITHCGFVVVLFSEVLVKVRVALPKSLSVAVVKARVTVVVSLVDRVTASRQSVTVADMDRLARLAARGPIALPMLRIAPATVGIPMPRFTGEFRSHTI